MPERKDPAELFKDKRARELVKKLEVHRAKRSEARIRSLSGAAERGVKYLFQTSGIGAQPPAKAQPNPPDILFLPKPPKDRIGTLGLPPVPSEIKIPVPSRTPGAALCYGSWYLPPYLSGTPLDPVLMSDPVGNVVGFEQAHLEGLLELYALTFDGDSNAGSQSGFRFRNVAASLLAGFFAVGPLTGPARLFLTTHVHTEGSSFVSAAGSNPTGVGLVQCTLTLHAGPFDGDIVEALAFPHCLSLVPPGTFGPGGYALGLHPFTSSNDLNVSLDVSDGAIVGVLVGAELLVQITSGSTLIPSCNLSSSSSPFMPPGQIHLESVFTSFCVQ